MTLDLPKLERYLARITIPSRDGGAMPFTPLLGSQRVIYETIAAGLERGVHQFIFLKGGRQIGYTTAMDGLSLYYLQEHGGMIGQYTLDSDDNHKYRRDVVREMLESIPKAYRWPVRVDNTGMMAWSSRLRAGERVGGSRLIFQHAGERKATGGQGGSKMGRSRGLNFRVDDEVGSWVDLGAISSLNASFSKRHPYRLRVSGSTARGHGPFKTMWDDASDSVTVWRKFIAWWMREDQTLDEAEQPEAWERYVLDPPTPDEKLWLEEIEGRYGHTITPGQLGWWRLTLHEEFHDDDAMMQQENGCLPELCFQAFGDKFIPGPVVSRLRMLAEKVGEPERYRYEWASSIDGTRVLPAREGPLAIWEHPDPAGVYVVSAHPPRSSSPDSSLCIVQVWRAWPDSLIQVAEYAALESETAMYQLAWLCIHLGGLYRTLAPAYFAMEVSTTGKHVLEEIQMIERYGYGLSPIAGQSKDVRNIVASLRHFCYRRPDSMTGAAPLGWKMSSEIRPWLMHAMRDEIERGHVEPRSMALLDELAGLRRGELGDNDQIGAGGDLSDSRAVATAYAIKHWRQTAMPDLRYLTMPRRTNPAAPSTVGERLVTDWMQSIAMRGRQPRWR